MIDDDSAIVTLLYGEATSKEEAEELAAYIEDKYTIEVELHNGGQPVYNYIFGVE
jgi:dihydroxyacetone kinase-like predicted kinase